jgi:hypothetical protein
MGIPPGARSPARSADALPAPLYGHFTKQYTGIGLLKDNTLMGSEAQCGEGRLEQFVADPTAVSTPKRTASVECVC